jgi:uncharacterized membrane protein
MDLLTLPQIFLLIIILAVLWIIVRFALRLTARAFSIGCGAILAIGFLLALIKVFNAG